MTLNLTILLIASVALGFVALAALALAAFHKLKGRHREILERRYFARWVDLTIAEKEQVLEAMGVIALPDPDGDPAFMEARLNDLFFAALIGSGHDLGFTPLSLRDALPLALLDVEMNWAFAQVSKGRTWRTRHARPRARR